MNATSSQAPAPTTTTECPVSTALTAIMRGLKQHARALRCMHFLRGHPLEDMANLPDGERQCAALLVAQFRLICLSPEGRKAALDLGLKPLFDDVERP